MFYMLMRFLLKQACRVYYKRMYVSGIENIPQGKPVIYASNHPNSFQDAVLIGINVNRPMTTLVRSDMFKSKIARFILSLWKLVPVYRIQEGSENLKKNDQTFEICKGILNKKGAVLIFSEGICITEKRLRPLKKGTARIALGASEQIDDIYIVPVGVNYTYLTDFHNDLMINFGNPIKVSDYVAEYQENQAKAINHLTTDLSKSMANELVIIENKENEIVTEAMLKIARSTMCDTLFPWKRYNRSRFDLEKKVCDAINAMNSENPQKLEALKTKVNDYLNLKKPINYIDDYSLNKKMPRLRYVLLILLFPIYLIGNLLNFFPLTWGKKIADKKVSVIEFYTSVRFASGYVLYLLFCMSVISVLLCSQSPLSFIIIVCIPLFSIIAANYKEAMKEALFSFKLENYKQKNRDTYNAIIEVKKQLLQTISKV